MKNHSLKKNLSSKGWYVVGGLNLLHGASHIIQPIQSFYLASEGLLHEHEHYHNSMEEIMHNPYMGLVWAGVGALSIYLGFRDRKKHKEHENEINELKNEISELEKELRA